MSASSPLMIAAPVSSSNASKNLSFSSTGEIASNRLTDSSATGSTLQQVRQKGFWHGWPSTPCVHRTATTKMYVTVERDRVHLLMGACSLCGCRERRRVFFKGELDGDATASFAGVLVCSLYCVGCHCAPWVSKSAYGSLAWRQICAVHANARIRACSH